MEGISRSEPAQGGAGDRQGGGRAGYRQPDLVAGADVVLGGGGYAAGPVGLAAVAARIPLVLTEADSHLGLTNRMLAGRARRVCLAFPVAGREGERYLVTGRPVPPTVTDRDGARERFGIAPGEIVVLVFGGSLGARSINEAAVRAFADAPYRVLHVAGRRDFAALTAPGEHYVLRDYVEPFGAALAAADLAVARAGGSVFELAQYGLPALLVPYPHASGNHQAANARWMARAGAATVLPDEQLTPPRLRAEVDTLVEDEPRWHAMAAASRRLARPDAARAVAREVLRAATRR